MVPSPHMGSSTKAPTYKNKGAVTHWARHTPPSVQSLLSHVLISHLLLSCTESNADNKSLLYQAKLAGKTISYKAWIALTNTMHLVLRSHIGKIHDWTADRYWLQINLWITVASVFLAKTRTSALTLQQWKNPCNVNISVQGVTLCLERLGTIEQVSGWHLLTAHSEHE